MVDRVYRNPWYIGIAFVALLLGATYYLKGEMSGIKLLMLTLTIASFGFLEDGETYGIEELK